MIQKKDVYSVYTHTSPSGKVYVGVSNNPKRRWGTYGAPYLYKNKNGNYTQACFANAINKYGWNNFNHEILLKNVSFSEALYAEKYLIRWYKIHNLSYNMSDGGEYYSGTRKPLSEERRLQVKEYMNAHHPMKGRHHTEEAKAKISEAAKNRKYTKEQKAVISEKLSKAHKGKHYKLSEEDRRRLSLRIKEEHKNGIFNYKGKKVYQYSFKGEYITSYPTVRKAAEAVQRTNSVIVDCANGKTLSAGGFIWSYTKKDHIDVSKYIVIENKIYDKERLNRRINTVSMKHVKAVNQYSLDGKYIATYNSIKDAKGAGYNGAIGHCCSHKPGYISANGYKWEYDTIDNRKDMVA